MRIGARGAPAEPDARAAAGNASEQGTIAPFALRTFVP